MQKWDILLLHTLSKKIAWFGLLLKNKIKLSSGQEFCLIPTWTKTKAFNNPNLLSSTKQNKTAMVTLYKVSELFTKCTTEILPYKERSLLQKQIYATHKNALYITPCSTLTTISPGSLIKHELSCHVYKDVYNCTQDTKLTDSEPTFGWIIDFSHFHESRLPNVIASVPQNKIIVSRGASHLGFSCIQGQNTFVNNTSLWSRKEGND